MLYMFLCQIFSIFFIERIIIMINYHVTLYILLLLYCNFNFLNIDKIKLVPIFKDQTSLSERALKAREHHSMQALIVRSYTMCGSLSLTIGAFLVLNFGNEFT